jgi:hypothetical protein
MALVVLMIVLIGVMGAGLLTFVSRDLESVVEVNQGQRAQEIADVGGDVARRHLAVQDAMPSSYDSVVTAGNSNWYDDPPGGPDEPGPKVLTFDGNQVTVGIRYLTPTRPTDPSDQVRQPNNAPEVLPTYGSDTCNDTNGDGVDDDLVLPSDVDACDYPNNRNYFRVTVRGGSGNALRAVQAIYVTQNFDFPVAYYATRDINFNGSASHVSGISLFANRYILNLRPADITGADQAYGNWAVNPYTGAPNPYNAVPRTDSSGSSTTAAAKAAGVAALGYPSTAATIPTCIRESTYRFVEDNSGITYDDSNENRQQKSGSAGANQKYAYRDYDRDSDYGCTSSLTPTASGRPDFRANTGPEAWGDRADQPPGTITFPFAIGNTGTDDEILTALKEKAQDQGLYTRRAPGSSFTIDDNGGDTPRYPADSDLTDTVMFIEFASGTDTVPVYGAKGTVTYKANSSDSDNLVKGTIVVVNGDLNTNSSADNFQGAIVIRDPNDLDNVLESNVMKYDNGGSVNVEGFLNVEGDISLRGNVDGFLPADLASGLPGLFKVSLWSWQECYNPTCGNP